MTTEGFAVPASLSDVVGFCRALADETRFAIIRRLSLTDLRGSEIVEWLGMPHNAISYHLRLLRTIGLLRDRRSSEDARDIYYSLDFRRLSALHDAVGAALHLGDAPALARADRPLRVLFLCTHNSARSQLAEAILRQRSKGTVVAYSAGSAPHAVHPNTLALLEQHGIDTGPHRAKPLAQFANDQFDYVITVCDRVRERCPVFPGNPRGIHWSIPDPVPIEDEALRAEAFDAVWHDLDQRIGHLLSVSRTPAEL